MSSTPTIISSNSNVPIFPEDKRLKGQENYTAYSSYVISVCRSKSLLGYLLGTIPNPGIVAPAATTTTTPTVTTTPATPAPAAPAPTMEEWTAREGFVAGMIYQNINDPAAHGITPEMDAVVMWNRLKAKFVVTSLIHQDIALKKLERYKLAEDGKLDDHLQELAKLQGEANALGCAIGDAQMIAITLASLPASWVMLVQVHQSKTNLAEVNTALREYWAFTHRDDLTATDPTALNATQTNRNTNVPICENCGRRGHNGPRCWAAGGGLEGKGPKWYRAPKGKEPRSTVAAATAPEATTTPPVAGMAAMSPLETYAIGDFTSDGTCSSALTSPDPYTRSSRPGLCRQALGLVIEGEGRRVEHVDSHPIAYASIAELVNSANLSELNVVPPNSHIPTYLDSGANVHCVAERSRFITYRPEAASGSTPNSRFKVEGKGVVRFDTKTHEGHIRRLLVDAIHVPSFSMNLISLPSLSCSCN